MITKNLNKHTGVVNGQLAKVSHFCGINIDVQLSDGTNLFVYPLTVQQQDESLITVYPIVPAYANLKSQGQTLKDVAIYFDVDTVPSGSAYVAVTGVQKLPHLHFIVPPKVQHFNPVILNP